MKTSNLILIGLGALGAYLFLRSKIKSESKKLVENALTPSTIVEDNPQIAPVGAIDPPKLILARASSMLPAPTASGQPLSNGLVDDQILSSAQSQGVPPSAVIKANLL